MGACWQSFIRTVLRCQTCSAGCGCCKTHQPTNQPQPTSLSRRLLGTDWAMSGGRITCLQQRMVCGDEESGSAATWVHAVRGPGQSRPRRMGQFRAPASYELTGTRRWSPHSAQSTCRKAECAWGSNGGSGAAAPQPTDRQHTAALSSSAATPQRTAHMMLSVGICSTLWRACGARPVARRVKWGRSGVSGRRGERWRRQYGGTASLRDPPHWCSCGDSSWRQNGGGVWPGEAAAGTPARRAWWRLWCSDREQSRSPLRGSAGN